MKPVAFAALCALALPLAGRAQTMVEHAVASGAAATGSSGMASAGKAAAGVLSKAAQVLDQTAAKAQGTVIRLPSASQPSQKLNLALPDVTRIKPGMDRAQLERDFGPPVMRISGAESETWWYGSGSDALAVEVLAGKVVSVLPPPKGTGAASPGNSKRELEKGETGVVILR
jgi:hypothetical protein